MYQIQPMARYSHIFCTYNNSLNIERYIVLNKKDKIIQSSNLDHGGKKSWVFFHLEDGGEYGAVDGPGRHLGSP